MPIVAAELMARVGVDGAPQAAAELKQVGAAFDATAAKAKASAGGLNAADAAMKSTSSSFGAGAKSVLLFGGAAGVGAAGAQALLSGITGLAGAAVNMAGGLLQAHASMEQTEVAFKQLLGSGAAATEMMGELRDLAAKTPFEFPELAKNARLLLAFGDNAKEVVPHLTAIGDAVSALGGGSAEIDRVTRAIGQMESKGRILAEEMNQLAEIGINGFAILAQETGKTEAELRRLGETGQLAAGTYIPLLYEGLQKVYGGGMAAQAKTFNGLWSTLKDNIQLAALEISKPFFEVAKKSLERFVEYTKTAEFEQRIQAWTEKAEWFADSIGSFVENEGPEIVRTIERMGEVAIPMAENFAIAIKLLDDLKVPKVLELWIAAENKWLSVLGFGAESVGKLADGYGDLYATLTGGQSAQEHATGALMEFVLAAGKAAIASGDAKTGIDEMAVATGNFINELERMPDWYFNRPEPFGDLGGSSAANGMRDMTAAMSEANQALATQAELVQQQGRDANTAAAVLDNLTRAQSEAAFLTDKLSEAQRALSDAYQIGLQIQADYTTQGSEYAGQAGIIEKAIEAVNRKISDGTATAEDYAFILEYGDEALGRFKGGMDDAAITAGEYAIKNGLLMEVQDRINEQYPHLVAGSEEYNQKLREAALAAGISQEEFDKMTGPSGDIKSGLDGITEAISGPEGLIAAIKELPEQIAIAINAEVNRDALDSLIGDLEMFDGSVYTANATVGFTASDGGDTYTPPSYVPPDTTGNGPRKAQGLPGIGPESLAAARDAVVSAAQYTDLIDEIVAYMAEAAERMGEGMEAAQGYARLADSAAGAMLHGAELLQALSGPPLAYTQAAAESVAALKFALEHAVQSIIDSAAVMNLEGLEGAQQLASAAGGILNALSDTLEFLIDITELSDEATLNSRELTARVHQLSEQTRMIAEQFAATAEGWAEEADPSVASLRDTIGDASGGLADTIDLLEAMSGQSDAAQLSQREILVRAHHLSEQAKLIAEQFAAAGAEWASDDMGTFSEAIQNAADALTALPEAFMAIAETSRISKEQTEIFYANFLDILDLIVRMDAAATPIEGIAEHLAGVTANIAASIEAAAQAMGDAAKDGAQALAEAAQIATQIGNLSPGPGLGSIGRGLPKGGTSTRNTVHEPKPGTDTFLGLFGNPEDDQDSVLEDVAEYTLAIMEGDKTTQQFIDTLAQGGVDAMDAAKSALQSMASTLTDEMTMALLDGSAEADKYAEQLQLVQGVLEDLEKQAKETGGALEKIKIDIPTPEEVGKYASEFGISHGDAFERMMLKEGAISSSQLKEVMKATGMSEEDILRDLRLYGGPSATNGLETLIGRLNNSVFLESGLRGVKPQEEDDRLVRALSRVRIELDGREAGRWQMHEKRRRVKLGDC